VRTRRLLFVLVFALLDGTTPLYAALGDAFRCVAPAALHATGIGDANLRIPGLRQAFPNLDREGRDYLIRTIAFEASGEPEEGKAAVAHVILNRARSGVWGESIKEVVTHPWQFEPWMTRRKEMVRLSPGDPRYQDAARIADDVLTGQRPDPTAGAMHFLNPTIVQQRRGRTLPSWALGQGQPIGNHTFYSHADGDTAPPSTVTTPIGNDDAQPLLAGRDIVGTAPPDGECGEQGLTATSPDLPRDNSVQLF